MNQDRINRNMRMKLAGVITFLEDNFNFNMHEACCTVKVCAFEIPDSCSKIIKNPQPVKATGGSDLLGIAARESLTIDECACGRPGYICGILECVITSRSYSEQPSPPDQEQ